MTTREDELYQSLSWLRIMLGAMMVGVIGFSVVALAIEGRFDGRAELAPVLLLVLAMLGVGEVVAYTVMRRSLMEQLRRLLEETADPGERRRVLVGHVNRLSIMGAAMAEGCGLFAAVIFLVTGAAVALIGVAVAVVVLLALLPTRARVSRLVAGVTGGASVP